MIIEEIMNIELDDDFLKNRISFNKKDNFLKIRLKSSHLEIFTKNVRTAILYTLKMKNKGMKISKVIVILEKLE